MSEKFEIKCKKCNSTDCTWWIKCYDSCVNSGLKCNNCDNEESDWDD